ncbi:MAG: acyl carrier protein [Nostoc sp.]|uniref:acyl carrier protein n=1 Tax=Nostoc sp. TaxID=1180 RepID=UPI002FF08423
MNKQPSEISNSYSFTNLNDLNQQVSSQKEITKEAIQAWLTSYLAEILETNSKEIDIQESFDRYGLDSGAAVGLTSDLEDWLKRDLSPTLLYEYPTIEVLSQYLAEEFNVTV